MREARAALSGIERALTGRFTTRQRINALARLAEQLTLAVRDAENAMAAIDDAVARHVTTARSAVADARLNYCDTRTSRLRLAMDEFEMELGKTSGSDD